MKRVHKMEYKVVGICTSDHTHAQNAMMDVTGNTSTIDTSKLNTSIFLVRNFGDMGLYYKKIENVLNEISAEGWELYKQESDMDKGRTVLYFQRICDEYIAYNNEIKDYAKI